MNAYKLEWFLLIESTPFGRYIKSVMGGALGEVAKAKASDQGLELVHIGGYGMPFHAGEQWNG